MQVSHIIAAAIIGAATLGATAPAWAVSNKSPSGHYYRPGEFCPDKDLGKTIHDPYGTLKCVMESGYPHWKRIG